MQEFQDGKKINRVLDNEHPGVACGIIRDGGDKVGEVIQVVDFLVHVTGDVDIAVFSLFKIILLPIPGVEALAPPGEGLGHPGDGE